MLLGQIPELAMLVSYPIGGLRPTAVSGKGVRYSREAQKLKEEGAAKDFPDLVLFVARGGKHGLVIELKIKGGYLRPGQRAWLAALEAQGYLAMCCWDWDEARLAILRYLGMEEG